MSDDSMKKRKRDTFLGVEQPPGTDRFWFLDYLGQRDKDGEDGEEDNAPAEPPFISDATWDDDELEVIKHIRKKLN